MLVFALAGGAPDNKEGKKRDGQMRKGTRRF